MAPQKEKPKHVRKAPDFIDEALIATLSKDKQAYWNRRKEGKNGQDDIRPQPKVIKTPQDVTIGFNNEGQMVAKTRAVRRQKLPTNNTKTKKTHSIVKARSKR
jgi:hypothetical protein